MKSFCIWIFLAILLSIPSILNAQNSVNTRIDDRLFPAVSATISGYVGHQLDLSYQNRIMSQDFIRLIEPFKNHTEDRCWQSEFWGKWFTSAVLAYKYRPEPALKNILEIAVTGLIATQTSDGYIGNYADNKHLEQWDIWGRKYCMLGLIAYYDLTKDKKSLLAAVKVADHLIKELNDKKALIIKMGNHHGMAASSVLEPICQLYTRTEEQKYLAFANEIVKEWETPEGPQLISKAGIDVALRFPKPKNWFGPEQGQKAYEMMSCYEGLLELYRITGKPEYKLAVEKTWQNIYDTEINITGSGSSVECWFGGKQLQTMHIDHYQETCVTATWIKLSQQLLRLTGNSKYADAIEQSWYNALLGAMFQEGADWAKYSPLAGRRLQGSDQCGMGLNCCVASGPRGLFTLPLTTIMSDKNGLTVNFFAEGVYKMLSPGGKQLEIVQKNNYPVSGNLEFKVLLQKEEQFKISIRIPEWSKQNTLSVNGIPVNEGITSGRFFEISRVWKNGDVINLTADMRGRIVRIGERLEQLAIVRGPIVLARDARLGTPHVDETIKPVTDKDGYINLEPVVFDNKNIRMVFKGSFILESHKEGGDKPIQITFCDFASAGNTLDEQSWFRVWLPQSYDPRK